MRAKKFFILIFLVMFISGTAYAEYLKVEISVTAEKKEFLLGEPVIVYVTVTNIGEEEIKIIPEVNPEVDIFRYFITDPSGKTKPFSPVYVAEPDTIKTLKQNESISGSARVFYGGHGYYFPKPGKYTVTVRYENIESKPLTLEILTPKDEAEKEQAKLILDTPEVGLFLILEGGDELINAGKAIETLTQKYPDSVLTSYCRYAVAKNYSVPARNFVTKKPRKANLPETIKILKSLKVEKMQLFYQSKVFINLSSSLTKMGKKDEARKVLLKFQKKLDEKKELHRLYLKKLKKETTESQ